MPDATIPPCYWRCKRWHCSVARKAVVVGRPERTATAGASGSPARSGRCTRTTRCAAPTSGSNSRAQRPHGFRMAVGTLALQAAAFAQMKEAPACARAL
jgi:hypothetical protein